MKLKHAMSVALATVSVGAGVILTQSNVALAHHTTVSGTAACVTDQSGHAIGWKVDWTADASNDRDRWKIAESGWSPSTEWINVTSNRTKTTNHALNEASASQTASVTWAYYSNSVIHGLYGPKSDTATVTKPSGCTTNGDTGWECPAGTVHEYKIDNLSGATFTVPTPPSGWTILAVIAKAGTQHKSYSPVTPGQVLPIKADMGHDVSHVHICKGTAPVPAQVNWTATNGTCVNPAGSLAVTYDSNKVTYTGSAPGSYADGATVTGSFTAKPGYTISGQTSFSHTFSVTGAPCVQTITPPTISGSYDCLSDGPATFTLNPASGNWTASGDQDPSKFGIQVTITANPGFTFAGGTTTVLTLTVAENDSCEVTAVAPSVDPATVCQTLDTYTIPDTPGVVYSQTPGTYSLNPGETVIITATAADGYRLTNPEFSVTLTGGPLEDCIIDPPTLTGHYDCVTDGPATFTLDPETGKWTASADQDPSKFGIQVTITANPGFTFADGTTKVLTTTVAEDNRCEVTAVDPTVVPTSECQKLDTYTIPNTANVIYTPAAGTYSLNPGESVTITATAAPKFRLTNPGFSVTITGGAVEDCLIDPPTLTASYDCVSEESSATLSPEDGEHWNAGTITKVDGENEYTVTITPEAGHRFAGTDGGPIVLTATFEVDSDCVIEPPVLTASYDCVSQQSSMALSPASSEQWTASEASLVGNAYSVTITANEGTRFAQGPSITLTADFEVTTGCEQTPVAPKVTPPTCSAPGSVDTTPTESYTWTKNQNGTYTAVAKPGVRLVGETTFGPFDTAQLTGDECAEPRIDVAAFSPVCVGDIPFIRYDIQVSGTSATVAKVTLRDIHGNIVAVKENAPLSGQFLYPGANDNPPDWPGWKQVDGKWVTDDTDHVWRQGLSVHVEVNPTADTNVEYPPATAPCFDPPVVDQGGPTTTTTTTTTTVTAQGGPVPSLPRTGSDSTGMAVTIGAMLLLGGLALLTAVRRPRRS